MKVNLLIESTDSDGTTNRNEFVGLFFKDSNGYRLTYSEDLSGEGIITKTTMHISDSELRIIRRGEIVTDFIYGNDLIHNTSYNTPYGNIPVTLITENFEYNDSFIEELLDNITIKFSYKLDVGVSSEPPTSMNMLIKITYLNKSQK